MGDIGAVGVVAAGEQALDEVPELHRSGLVEAQLRPDALDGRGVGLLADESEARVGTGPLRDQEEDGEGRQR